MAPISPGCFREAGKKWGIGKKRKPEMAKSENSVRLLQGIGVREGFGKRGNRNLKNRFVPRNSKKGRATHLNSVSYVELSPRIFAEIPPHPLTPAPISSG